MFLRYDAPMRHWYHTFNPRLPQYSSIKKIEYPTDKIITLHDSQQSTSTFTIAVRWGRHEGQRTPQVIYVLYGTLRTAKERLRTMQYISYPNGNMPLHYDYEIGRLWPEPLEQIRDRECTECKGKGRASYVICPDTSLSAEETCRVCLGVGRWELTEQFRIVLQARTPSELEQYEEAERRRREVIHNPVQPQKRTARDLYNNEDGGDEEAESAILAEYDEFLYSRNNEV